MHRAGVGARVIEKKKGSNPVEYTLKPPKYIQLSPMRRGYSGSRELALFFLLKRFNSALIANGCTVTWSSMST